jgi:hypothetical protein
LDDKRQRNILDCKLGMGISRFGLGLIPEKLAITQGSAIAFDALRMNLEKLLDLLLGFFVAKPSLLSVNEGGRNVRAQPLKPQIAFAR